MPTAGIVIAGAGPAGCSAALALRRERVACRVFERSAAPKHKVCGEFLSPGSFELLESLGVWGDFLALGPARIHRCVLHVGNCTKKWRLADAAWGLSRLELDRMLAERAAASGAEVVRGQSCPVAPAILAVGRKSFARGGEDRLFGFKAHFEGPPDDAVELYFDNAGYVGVNAVENRRTNVCGIAPESLLKQWSFDFDAFVRRSDRLAARLRPLERRMNWIATGPLAYSSPADADLDKRAYRAGDALGFVDPFTGSGILNALASGRMAGLAAARALPVAEYLRTCRQLMARPFRISSILRGFLRWRGTGWLAACVPGDALFRYTRASSAGLRATLSQPAALFPRL